jgi:hypothetical protein
LQSNYTLLYNKVKRKKMKIKPTSATFTIFFSLVFFIAFSILWTSSSANAKVPARDHEEPSIVQNPIAKLTASDGSHQDYFSDSAVAISGDTIAIGAFMDDDGGEDSGSAYIFERPTGGWGTMNETAKLTASDATSSKSFGKSIAISDDTVLVSSHDSIYIFERPLNGWVDATETIKLSFEGSPWMAIDKDTIAISYSIKNVNSGFIAVYTRPNNGWKAITETARLTMSDNSFVSLAAISGNTIVGITKDGPVIYLRPEDGWVSATETTKLMFTDPDPAYRHYCGGLASISKNEDVIAFGCSSSIYYGNGNSVGMVYIFERPNNGWVTTSQSAILKGSLSDDSRFGSSVAIEGETLVVGALGESSVYVYKRPTGGWVRMNDPYPGQKKSRILIPSSPAQNFGDIAGISEGIVVVSASGDNDTSGSAYVFDIGATFLKEVFLPSIIKN